MSVFRDRIYQWYTTNKRDLPWRETNDPYKIWLSEIILQQTKVAQGLDYYALFVDKFPTISDLAAASEDEVLKLWQGLGYYSRARNLHFTAKYLANDYNGIFPSDYNSILKLKGVGEYTASAIASIAFHLPYSVVDGNVYRVLARYFGIDVPIDTSQGKNTFRKLAKELLNTDDPSMHNQAMMDFGALQCVPVNPNCDCCPLKLTCKAFINYEIDKFPAKGNITKIRNRYFNYFVIFTEHSVFLRKRTGTDIWKNLYEFPLIETHNKSEIEQLFKDNEFLSENFNEVTIEQVTGWKIHKLSHQRINYRFIVARAVVNEKITLALVETNKKDIFRFAVPKLLENFINNSGLFAG